MKILDIYIILNTISFLNLIFLPFAGISVTISLMIYIFSTISIIFSSDTHPTPSKKDIFNLKNESPKTYEVSIFNYFNRINRRNSYVYIILFLFITSLLFYNNLKSSEHQRVFLMISWIFMLMSIVIVNKYQFKRTLFKVCFEYLNDTQIIDFSYEKTKKISIIKTFLFDNTFLNKSKKNINYIKKELDINDEKIIKLFKTIDKIVNIKNFYE